MSDNEYVFVEHVEDTPNTPPRGRIRKLRNSVRRGFSKMGRRIRNSGRRLFSKKRYFNSFFIWALLINA